MQRVSPRFSPIADTKHEEILAIIHYYHLPLPPIYTWYAAFVLVHIVGLLASGAEAWKMALGKFTEIDSSLVEEAANYIPSARQFLQGKV